MATSSTTKLMQLIHEGQAQMLDYLNRADERGERQSRASMKALSVMQESLRVIQAGQQDIALLAARTLELTRDIHSAVLEKKSSSQ
jgi:hypothetical protein